jgi:hypothetical protein
MDTLSANRKIEHTRNTLHTRDSDQQCSSFPQNLIRWTRPDSGR